MLETPVPIFAAVLTIFDVVFLHGSTLRTLGHLCFLLQAVASSTLLSCWAIRASSTALITGSVRSFADLPRCLFVGRAEVAISPATSRPTLASLGVWQTLLV